MGEKDARLVVIGNSDSRQINGPFAAQWRPLLQSVDWLAQDENLISIRPKESTDRPLTLTESQLAGLWWVD